MQLLISVKNVEEALLALNAGADLIDLKDPNIGALGALDLASTAQIVQALAGRATLSATAGEHHASLSALLADIEARADLGVDIIKIALSPLCYEQEFFNEMAKLTRQGIKLVAVFFADDVPDWGLLPILRQIGFYGAMLDTKNKAKSLLLIADNNYLQAFACACVQNELKFGLAGSLKTQDVDFLAKLKPTFIGFRGGVCDNFIRQSSISKIKMAEVKNMLLKHNKNNTKAQKSMHLALHS